MFGSGQMVWPDAVDAPIRGITDVPFLTSAQKRDILYNNAARFFRLGRSQLVAANLAAELMRLMSAMVGTRAFQSTAAELSPLRAEGRREVGLEVHFPQSCQAS